MFCTDIPPPVYLIFTSGVPHILYYSHIPAIIVSLFFGFFIFFRDKRSLIGISLLLFSFSFALWSIADLILWTNNNSQVIIFFWSLISIFYALIYIFGFYFTFLYLKKKDLSFFAKSLLFLPIIFIASILFTKFNIKEFNLTDCGAIESGFVTIFRNILGGILTLLLFIIAITKYKSAKDDTRKQILYLSIGSILFLFTFFLTGLLADILYFIGLNQSNYGLQVLAFNIGQYGLFGVIIFYSFLAYLIVKFKAFKIKILSTQALIVALIVLIGSLFFVLDLFTIRIITGITLILTIVLGYILVRSVKLEVQRKEELQALSTELAAANDKLHVLDKAKSEFISIASHQLRTPLTSIKGFGSLLLEGTYGPVPEAQKNALEKIYISNERLIQLVEDLLNISRIEAGRMEFDFQEAQIEDLVQEAVTTLELSAKARRLYLHWQKPTQLLPKIKIDITKIKEVISNMVDNAIKYTQKGGVTVRVEKGSFFDHNTRRQKSVVRVIVSDTGIGMDKEELESIFNKFERGKEVSHYHTDGTGLGMYIGKKIVAEHKGKLWAESEGRSKGSQFILELPVS